MSRTYRRRDARYNLYWVLREYTRTNPVRWAFDRHNPAMEETVGVRPLGPEVRTERLQEEQ